MEISPWRVPREVIARIARTAVFMWLAARLCLAMVGLISLGPWAQLLFVGAVVALTRYDVRVTREDILFANLGVHPGFVVTLTALVAGSLEVGLGLLMAGVPPTDLLP